MLMSLYLFLLCTGFILCLFILNPIFLIIWLIILSLLMGAALLMLINSWMTYAVVLLFTSGMMILFSYMLSLTMPMKINFFSLTKLMLISWSIIIFYNTLNMNNLNYFMISDLFMENSIFLLMTMAIYLLLILLSMVKMASSLTGPMKSYFTYEL